MRRAAVLAVVLLLCLPQASAAADTLQVRGAVFNGTTGKPGDKGLEVEIAVVGPDGGQVDVATATLDSSGRFRSKVNFAPGARTVVSARFEGITYSAIARAGTTVARAELRVFETTRDPGVLSVDADTTVVERSDSGELEVLAIVRMANASNRTFIGETEDEASFRLPLPKEATSVSVVEGLTPGRSQPSDGALLAGDPLQPGEASISYAYKLPVNEGEWAFDRTTFFPTERLDVLVEPDLELGGGDFTLLGEIDFGGESYRQYVVDDVEAEESLSFSVAQPPGAGVWPVVAGGMGLLVIGGLGWRMGRLRARRATPRPRRERVLEEIAALDLAFESGDVEDKDYATKRADLKARLRSSRS